MPATWWFRTKAGMHVMHQYAHTVSVCARAFAVQIAFQALGAEWLRGRRIKRQITHRHQYAHNERLLGAFRAWAHAFSRARERNKVPSRVTRISRTAFQRRALRECDSSGANVLTMLVYVHIHTYKQT